MSWREVLGPVKPASKLYTQYPHNTHNTPDEGSSADIADSAGEDPELLEATSAGELSVTAPVKECDTPILEDTKNRCNDANSVGALADSSSSMVERREMDRDGEPAYYIEHAESTIDHEQLIRAAIGDLPVTSEWVHQFVICEEDVEDIRRGDLPLSCLRAHIEYHLKDQREWQKRKQEINGTYGNRK